MGERPPPPLPGQVIPGVVQTSIVQRPLTYFLRQVPAPAPARAAGTIGTGAQIPLSLHNFPTTFRPVIQPDYSVIREMNHVRGRGRSVPPNRDVADLDDDDDDDDNDDGSGVSM